MGLAAARGRALAIAVNKWDGLTGHERRLIEREVARRLDFVPYASLHYISALHGSGIAELVDAALLAHRNAGVELATPRLNKVLADALAVNPPPLIRGRQVRLRYAHQGGRYPPLIVVHGNQADRLPAHYKRYLENAFREALRLRGTPGADRAAHRRESVRRTTQSAHAESGATPAPAAAVQASRLKAGERTRRAGPNHIARS